MNFWKILSQRIITYLCNNFGKVFQEFIEFHFCQDSYIKFLYKI